MLSSINSQLWQGFSALTGDLSHKVSIAMWLLARSSPPMEEIS
jgi:hypothetical protein